MALKPDTLLLRQVNPSFVQGDVISSQVFSSQVFRPTAKDHGLLSVYHGDKFDADKAHQHFTDQNLPSAGVVAVSCQECHSEQLPVHEDNKPFDGHCSIDYTHLASAGQVDKKAKKLKAYAQQRGWLYRA